jgi:NAD(P)-dependent dehydrogenase (short-subunit alcohol dehydrogenase family)
METLNLIIMIVGILIGIVIILYLLRKYFNSPKTPFIKSMHGKIVIVTGSNTGIGKETALDLLEKGAKVIFACRSEIGVHEVINNITNPIQKEDAFYMHLDLTNFGSINNFVDQFKTLFGRLDVLVNNAGAIIDIFELKEGIESSIMTNHVGPVYLTCLLLPLINSEGLVINVSSSVNSVISQKKFNEKLQDIYFTDSQGIIKILENYSFSKLCNIMFTLQLKQYSIKNNISFKTASVYPGVVATKFLLKSKTCCFKIFNYTAYPFRQLFLKDAKIGAQTILHIIYCDYLELKSGAYFKDCKEANKNSICDKPENVVNLMKYTKQLIFKNLIDIPVDVEIFFSDI